ncbi:hypothetical protein RHECIAT_PC0000731 (plasmid) [Rhizobium etli CIAT 652]|uniref:Uncharacterized protein n=1 Tax=Rhizobium etli (strain CIAT 652) TaxID=491916 RepID=B3Q404_RHIE6|nr:hypothetical protein RHECIAT_PC0000731 [Rhizobium etli CIAT 652]
MIYDMCASRDPDVVPLLHVTQAVAQHGARNRSACRADALIEHRAKDAGTRWEEQYGLTKKLRLLSISV